MDTQTFWSTVGLIVTALLLITPLAHRTLGAPAHERRWLHAAGALAVLSFALDAGPLAAAMTLPWFCLGIVLASNAARRTGVAALLHRPTTAVEGPLATWVWMAAGGAWLTAHRAGLAPLDFDRAVTLLTVAHFHVAGLGLTALLVATSRRRPGHASVAAIWVHQVGMLAVAAGLTVSDHLEVVGATAITVALAIWAAVVVRWTRGEVRGVARTLLSIAAVAWLLPMVLALGWALGPFLPEPVVTTFATMLRFHAALQTFGLVLCGLAGVLLSEPLADRPALTALTDRSTEEDHDDVAHETHA